MMIIVPHSCSNFASLDQFTAPQELMAVDEQAVRLALLRKAFQSDWDGAAPSAPSSNG